MKNLLVTGGCGFIGSNFIRYLLEEVQFQGRIINLDKLTYAGNPQSLQDLEEKYSQYYLFIQGDICDARLLEHIFKAYKIDSICHFAAETHVDRSIASCEAFIETNVKGTMTLLETTRKFHNQVLLFHHISTDEVYGSLGEEGFFTEETPYHPNNPYSASKAASDHLVLAYANTYNLPITLSNCSNNYGPFQFPEKLIPLTILNILHGKSIPVYGEGLNTRDWLYVTDHCRAIWKIMTEGSLGECYNIGGHNEIKNIEIVQTICDLMDRELNSPHPSQDLITFVPDRPGHDWRYAIDASKIQKELNWTPQESFNTGIEKTIHWYLKNLQWVKFVQSGEYFKWIKQHYSYNKN